MVPHIGIKIEICQNENQNLQNWNRKNQKFSKSITIRYTSVKWTLRFVKIKIIKIEIKKKIFFLKILIFFLKCQECLKVRREKNFPKIFFWFSCSEWFNSQKKAKKNFWKILIFFLSLRNVGDFEPFDPWRENQSFFWYGVFAKC